MKDSLEATVPLLEGWDTAEINLDRRQHPRRACALAACLFPIGLYESGWPADVCDLSTKGLGLVSVRRFERGATVAVEWPGPDDAKCMKLLGKVVHVKRHRDDQWRHGILLAGILDAEELDAALGAGESGASRAAARVFNDEELNRAAGRYRVREAVAELREAMRIANVDRRGTSRQDGGLISTAFLRGVDYAPSQVSSP
jgi:hypothetical protein